MLLSRSLLLVCFACSGVFSLNLELGSLVCCFPLLEFMVKILSGLNGYKIFLLLKCQVILRLDHYCGFFN